MRNGTYCCVEVVDHDFPLAVASRWLVKFNLVIGDSDIQLFQRRIVAVDFERHAWLRRDDSPL
jgi:hypothetical protein